MHEIYDAVMTLKPNKCPGIDGIPAQFYKTFWYNIKDILFELFTEVYKDNIFHLSTRCSIIILIDKPGRDALNIENC